MSLFLLLLCIINFFPCFAREFRTPLPLQKGPIVRLLPESFTELHCYDCTCEDDDPDTYWLLHFFTAPFWRTANQGLCSHHTSLCSQCSLGEIYFGIPDIGSFNYSDWGIFLGLFTSKYLTPEWRFCAQAQIPFRSFTMAPDERMRYELRSEHDFSTIGICFRKQKNIGIGDFDSEISMQYHFSDALYGKARFGIRLPSAMQIEYPEKVFFQSLGNNGHIEVLLGLETGWQPCSWLQFNSDASYSFVTNSIEQVAAPHAGAMVKNIGCGVPTDISWGYFLGHCDCTLISFCYDFHLALSYEYYHKIKDVISFDPRFVNIFLFDQCLLEKNTAVTAHTIRTELLYSYCSQSSTLDFFAGYSIVIAGNNTPRDHGWHFGVQIRF